MKILITGICGFIPHHLTEHIIKNTDWEIIGLDNLTYASRGFDRLRDIKVYNDKRVKIFTHDITRPISEELLREIGEVDYILHLAANTHVDNSIIDPEPFVMTNVVGTMHMLDFARKQLNLKHFLYFSTDEIFGPAPVEVAYKEWDRYNSGNPYSASKAGGEELCLAYANTYHIPILITHTMNVFGERQHPEKFIPKVIRAALDSHIIPIHSDKTKTVAGSRMWIHARNVAAAILHLLEYTSHDSSIVVPRPTYWRPEYADKFNVVGEREVDNLAMAKLIHKIVMETVKEQRTFKYEMVDFHSSRPGHDLRYALDGSKMKAMGWSLPMGFEDSLRKTVEWTVQNPKWLNIISQSK